MIPPLGQIHGVQRALMKEMMSMFLVMLLICLFYFGLEKIGSSTVKTLFGLLVITKDPSFVPSDDLNTTKDNDPHLAAGKLGHSRSNDKDLNRL